MRRQDNGTEPLLSVQNLKQYFPLGHGRVLRAVDDVSFSLNAGETYALVGESGSGKSTIARTVIRLYEPTEGKILYDGRDLSGRLSAETNEFLRSGMQMIFQDVTSSLNPRKRVEDIVALGLDVHRRRPYAGQNAAGEIIPAERRRGRHWREERRTRVEEALLRVGLHPSDVDRYPDQLSGGQRQRVGIARALIMEPRLIIADECISALDVSVQAQIVNLLKELQRDTGVALLFISHDLAMVRYLSDRIGVLRAGKLVETGTTEQIFSDPAHPYTRELLEAARIRC